MLSSTVCMSNTVGVWNLRPMPSSAIAASSSAVRSCEPSNRAVPSFGRVFPVITSIIVVLPAPFGPMMARISAWSMASDRAFSARKPSKETRDVVEIEQRRGDGCAHGSLRRLRDEARGAAARSQRCLRPLPEILGRSEDAAAA